MVKFPDGTVRVLVEGLWRIRVKKFEPPAPYLRAGYDLLRDETEDSVELQAMLRNAHKQFEEIAKLSTALTDQVKIAALNTEHPGHFADLIAANLNLSLEDRQKLLETISVRERLQKLLPMLNREQEVLTLSSKIQSDVASNIAKTQRDFFLREQMRAIQRELGEGEPAAGEAKSLREQIEAGGFACRSPQGRRTGTGTPRSKCRPPPPNMPSARNYLDWILALPWEKSTEDKLDLKAAEKVLNEQHFGLGKVKDRLLEFLAVIKRRKEIKGPILCLVGPPGVGKTSLGKSVADALGRKFARISLGGMRDEAEIRGHRRTYVGAMPGRIIQTLRRVESSNPVILLDELDKVGADFRGDPASALLEVLDPAQNNTFTDHYLDLPFDLSRVLFIATANWLDPIHPALRDRLEVIELPSYTESEKLQIAKRYLVPRQLEEHGLTRSDVKFTDAALRQLIREYTREAGVRQLEREIAALARKAARKIVARNGAADTVKLDAKDLEKYLGHAKFVFESAEKIHEIGIATGLAWTPVGGDMLFIEATRMRGRGSLILTGSLGEVMKESAQTAVSYLRSRRRRSSNLDFDDYGKNDLHIHVPAGATPKDGPSAGVTIVRRAGVADEPAARAFRHGDDRRNQPARPRAARGRHQGKGDRRVAVRREAGDSAGGQQGRLAGRAGGGAREIEGAFREADFRGAAPGARGEISCFLRPSLRRQVLCLRRPSVGLRRPAIRLRRASGDLRRPSFDLRRLSDDLRRPSDQLRRVFGESRRLFRVFQWVSAIFWWSKSDS